jgi:hypothetical protein
VDIGQLINGMRCHRRHQAIGDPLEIIAMVAQMSL